VLLQIMNSKAKSRCRCRFSPEQPNKIAAIGALRGAAEPGEKAEQRNGVLLKSGLK